MAIRRRTIQPSIWQDPDFGMMSDLAKLIFIGMITQADDEGRLQGHPAIIGSMMFPYHSKLEQVIEAMQEIQRTMKNVCFYEVNGQVYIQLKNWEKHQTLRQDRTQKSLIPQPTANQVATNCQPSAAKVREVSKVSKGSKGNDNQNKNFNNLGDPLAKLRKQLEDKGILKRTKLL